MPTTVSTALIKVADLRICVGGRTLRDSLTLAIEPGSVVRIAGRNGAGKTTLIRQILGFSPRPSGTVLFSTPMQVGDGLGYFPQTWPDTLLPWLDAWSNVLLGVARIPRAAIGQPFLELAERLFPSGLNGLGAGAGAGVRAVLAARRVDQMSGGEQQKIAILRTLVGGPRVLFLDEPYRDLDQGSTTALNEYLKSMIRTATVACVIYVSHQEVGLEPTQTVNL